jgi:hypothetical protein
MSTIQAVKNIQNKFNINAIYARMVFDLVKTEDIDKISKIIEEKPKPFIK